MSNNKQEHDGHAPTPLASGAIGSEPGEIANVLIRHHSADATETLNSLDHALVVRVIEALPLEVAVQVFNEPNLHQPSKVIAELQVERAAAILSEVRPDRRARLFRRLPEKARQRLRGRLAAPLRSAIDKLLSYPPESAAGIMTTELLAVPADWTVGQALELINKTGSGNEAVYTICLLDPATKRLVQVISLRCLVTSDPSSTVLSAARPHKLIKVSPFTDREEVARVISKYDLLAVPVVDRDDHVLGIVTVDDVIDAIIEEGTEDVHKFGGVEALDQPYLRVRFQTMIRKRAGWLCALFISEMLTASAMQHYEAELEKAMVLALFIPLVMSSGGNSGSQATSLIIRALALREFALNDWWRIALRELPAGFTLGTILGLIGIARIAIWQLLEFYDYGSNWLLVALTVGLALTAIVTFGSLAGAMLPFILKSLRFDPAAASAPFVATLVDVSGLVIYFSVAYIVLHGVLL